MPRKRHKAQSQSHHWLRLREARAAVRQAKRETRAPHAEIVHRYARMRNGKPAFCSLTEEERQIGRQLHGATGKVIYDDESNAWAAAYAFMRLGDPETRPYPCPRSRHGHYHLSTVRKRKGVEEVERRSYESSGE